MAYFYRLTDLVNCVSTRSSAAVVVGLAPSASASNMADYDRRYRGDGGRGGYNPRKRRYNDDDDYGRNRGGGRRRHDGSSHAPPFIRIRKQLLGLAESAARKWHEDVVSVSRLVVENYDDEFVRNGFLDLVCQLVVEQPLKTPFVAAVVLVTNTLKSELVAELLARVGKALETAITAGEWRDVKALLKLLACLQTCLEGEGIFPVLDELFNRAVDLQTASSDDTIGIELVKIILLTIPYIMAAAPGQWIDKAAELMDKTDVIASEDHPMQKLVDPYCPEAGEKDVEASPSLLSLLQKQLQTEAGNGWGLECLPRPWKMPLEEVEQQSKLDDCPRHPLPTISVPETIIAGSRPLFPEVSISIYAAQDVASVPPDTTIAASLIRDAILDTINTLHYNRNVVARFLIDLDCYFSNGTFVKRATPFDRLRDVEAGKSTWKPEDVVVDAVFSQILQLPRPEHKLVFYHSVLTETCKIAPAAIAPSLGRAIRHIYRNIPRHDLELNHRFIDWFSHHLSNFGFTWKWVEWVDDVELPALHPLKAFIVGALDKEIRLSFAQRIKNTVPDEYKSLIGPEKEIDVPEFKYKNDDVPFASQGREIANLLKKKEPDEAIQPLIEEIQNGAVDQGLDPLVTSTDVFMTAVLAVGSKSLSHVLACIERVKDRLLDAGAASVAARIQVIEAVMAYWSAHQGVALSIVEKLLNYAILTPAVVVEWAVGAGRGAVTAIEDDESRLAQDHIYELVLNTVRKVTGRVRQVALTKAQNLDGDVSMTEDQDGPEVKEMRELFQLIEHALAARASSLASNKLLARLWVDRWQRAFKRCAAIEENFLIEVEKNRKKQAAIAAAAPAPEAKPEVKDGDIE